jgi:RND family efflux transporter MFP subunit
MPGASGQGLQALTGQDSISYITDWSVIKFDVSAVHALHRATQEGPNMYRRLTVLAMMIAGAVAGCSRPAAAPEPLRSVRTYTVGAQSVGTTVDYAAEVRARTESRLSFRVPGMMVSRPVELGESVKAGQLLARLDPSDLRLGQDAARSGLEAAQVNADQASADFKRFKTLYEQGFISAAELDRRESTFKSAQAQAAQARAQANTQGNLARYASLVADANGVITAVEAEPGAVLATGATVLRLARDGPRDAVFAVPEHHVGRLRALQGQPGALQVRLWGAGDVLVPAVVREVAAAADPATRTFMVKADIGRAPARLGQTATVSLAVPGAPGVFKVPLPAVFEQQGQSTVWLLDAMSMSVRAQTVRVVGAEGNMVLIGGGLTAGQKIVSAGTHTLTAGQKVALLESRLTAPAGASASSAPR